MAQLHTQPHDIERTSFEIIARELGDRELDPPGAHHQAGDPYHGGLLFCRQPGLYQGRRRARVGRPSRGATILTDTNMARSGISRPALAALGCTCACYMADEDVAERARQQGTTRAFASMDKACGITGPLIIAVGNAPTALLRLCELMDEGRISPDLVIGVPVGFVNVVEAKEEVLARSVPAIVARGRKGGSTVAAAIVNALLYQLTRDES